MELLHQVWLRLTLIIPHHWSISLNSPPPDLKDPFPDSPGSLRTMTVTAWYYSVSPIFLAFHMAMSIIMGLGHLTDGFIYIIQCKEKQVTSAQTTHTFCGMLACMQTTHTHIIWYASIHANNTHILWYASIHANNAYIIWYASLHANNTNILWHASLHANNAYIIWYASLQRWKRKAINNGLCFKNK